MNVELGLISLAVLMGLMAMRVPIGLALIAATAQADVTYVCGAASAPSEPRPREGTLPWLEALTAQSDGRIQSSFLGGGAVVTAKNSMSAMRDGLIDGAFISTICFPAESPVNSLFVNIGGIMRDPIVASAALTEMSLLHYPECDAEFKEWKTRNLGSSSLPSYSLISKPEVRTLEDVSGLRVRSSGHTVTLASAIGTIPTNMTYTEVYEGMQPSQIDCTFGGAGWLESLPLGDVAKTVLRIDAGAVTAPSTYNIREDLWQSLSPEDRQVFIDTVPIATARAAFGPVNEENTVLETPGRNDMQLQPDDAMIDAIKAQSENDFDAAITKAEGAGVGNAADIVARFREVYARWDGLVTPDLTVDAYQALLKREIYDHYPIE